MPNGRRRTTRATRARPTRGGRRNGAPSGPPSALGGLHPAILVGLVVVPLLLIVAVVLVSSGGKKEEPQPETPFVEQPTQPSVLPTRSRTPEPEPDVARPPTKAEMDILERNWAPLRKKYRDLIQLRDEGVAFWKQEESEKMQEKFRAAARIWRTMRDRAQELLGKFSDEQMELYLGKYETELARWSTTYAEFQKMIVPED
jgi:hypothetical protein